MSLFIVSVVSVASLFAGLFVAVSERIRAQLRRREATRPEEQLAIQVEKPMAPRQSSPAPAATERERSRAAAYREILDALGDDLDEDIAEWEAVLQDFPQVIGAEQLLDPQHPTCEPVVKTSEFAEAAPRTAPQKQSNTPNRTRRIDKEERDMICRLLKTGFAPEEIALWLNLPLERVQELWLGERSK